MAERDVESMEAFLELGVFPQEVKKLKQDRAYHGVPTYFETPPTRSSPDLIQPFLRDHAVGGIGSIWEMYRGGKLFLVSSAY